MPQISVVVPIYNSEKYLRATLNSLRAQSNADWEGVLIDDGSSDNSAGIARDLVSEDARFHFWQQNNTGIAGARNRGLAEARGESVLFLDNDDLLEPSALEALSAALGSHSNSSAAYGLPRFVDEKGEPIAHYISPRYGEERSRVHGRRLRPVEPGEPTTFEVLLAKNCIWTTGQVLIRRSRIEELGGFDASTCPCDDWDLWLRLSRLGPLAMIPQTVMQHRRHSSNTSGNTKLMRRADIALRRKLLLLSSLPPGQKRLARDAYHGAEARYAREEAGLIAHCLRTRLLRNAVGHSRRLACHLIRALPGTPPWPSGAIW